MTRFLLIFALFPLISACFSTENSEKEQVSAADPAPICAWIVDCRPAAIAPGGPGGDSTGCEPTPIAPCNRPVPAHGVTCSPTEADPQVLFCQETH